MKVFLTGATGFIGTALVPELIGAGHQVLGLGPLGCGSQGSHCRRCPMFIEASWRILESLRAGAAHRTPVIHAGFVHDFSKYKEVCEIDRRAIEALGSVLAGSDRHLIVTSGLAGLAEPGQLATEDDVVSPDFPFPRVSEQTALALKGVSASVVRLPQVHDPIRQGLVTFLIALSREKGLSPYVAEGRNRWGCGACIRRRPSLSAGVGEA